VYSSRGSECKELLASLGGREVAQALDDTTLVVTLAKFRQCAAQFLDVPKHPHPQQLLFQRANESFNAAVGVSRGLRRNVTVQSRDGEQVEAQPLSIMLAFFKVNEFIKYRFSLFRLSLT
jgi:hypothetical protein